MKKIALLIFFFCGIIKSYAQDYDTINRRANYFETFLPVSVLIDSIVVYKSKREMIVFHQKAKIKKYIISLGYEPVGKKQFEGDMKTPEGLYFINDRTRVSSYYANLGISYPNEADSTYAAQFEKSAGGEIKIHGFPNIHNKADEKEYLNSDWTMGCIAVSNFELDELYSWIKLNCPILILP